MMQSENLLRFFHLVCTDTTKPPDVIKLTPTIVLKGNPTFYVAGDAFGWLARVKQWKVSMLMEQLDKEQREHLAKVDGNLKIDQNNYLGFSEIEMASMSDIFSFFSKNLNSTDEALPQSYQKVDMIGKYNIFAPPLEGTSYDASEIKKPSVHMYTSACQRLKQERAEQDQKLKQAIASFRNNSTNYF